MIKISKIDTENNVWYEVEDIHNWNEFTEWLYNLEDVQMSLSFSGNLYRFRTKEERRYFVLGFSKAWDVIDDKYLNRSYGEKEWH